MTTRIKVIQRTFDFHAYIDGRPGIWDRGGSVAEAIGNLIMSQPEDFNIDFETQWRAYNSVASHENGEKR